MNVLSIVLTSIISALVIIIIIAIVCIVLMNKLLERKISDQEVLNKYAPKSPIVFLGDSLTDFYPMYEIFHDPRIVNRGIANDTTSDVNKRLGDVLELEPRIVFLQIGINDFTHTFKKLKPEVVVARIIRLIEKIRENTQLKLISLYPVNRHKNIISKFTLRHTNNKMISSANALLENYCEKNGIDFINVYPTLLDEKGDLRAEFTIEGLHYTNVGYEAITKVIKPYVDAIE